MNDEIQNMEDVEVFFERANSTEVTLWVLYMQLLNKTKGQSESPHYKTTFESEIQLQRM